jgi:hypothetical protein
MADTVMPFGMHKGKPVCEVPTPYLQWCLNACKRVSRRLRTAIEREMVRREPGFEPPTRSNGRVTASADLAAKVRQVYRQLALEMHPDRGGSHEAMKAINLFHERLQELMRDEG